VGEFALPVAVVATELGVSWWTVMDAVVAHGTPLVEDPERVGWVRALGIDETSFLSATREHHTIYATGLVDLDEPKVIDMVEGNGAADLRRWFEVQDPLWLETIEVVATDLAESYRRGMAGSSRPHRARRRSLPCRARRQPDGRQGAPPQPHGRGLLIVRLLAHDWGGRIRGWKIRVVHT